MSRGGIRPSALRIGLPVVTALIGAAGIGLVVAAGLAHWLFVAFVVFLAAYCLVQGPNRIGAAYAEFSTLRASATHEPLRYPQEARWVLREMLAAAIVLPLYGAFLSLTYDEPTVGKWIATFQPAVDWLSAYVPAIHEKSKMMIERGNWTGALALQHMLFVGWTVSIGTCVWVVLDLFIIHKRAWSQFRPRASRRRMVTTTMGLAVFLMATFLVLFVGLTSTRAALNGAVALPFAGLGFAALILCTFAIGVYLNSLVRSYVSSQQ